MAKFAINASGAILLPSLVQVSESISGSVVPLAMFIVNLRVFFFLQVTSCLQQFKLTVAGAVAVSYLGEPSNWGFENLIIGAPTKNIFKAEVCSQPLVLLSIVFLQKLICQHKIQRMSMVTEKLGNPVCKSWSEIR